MGCAANSVVSVEVQERRLAMIEDAGDQLEELLGHVRERSAVVSVIELGYVALP